MIVIIDYGMGNLKSVSNTLNHLSIPFTISSNIETIKNAKALILPGVGSFKEGMKNLEPYKNIILEKVREGCPLLGICLGMQMLFEKSYEGGETRGLSIIDGEVRLLEPTEKVKIPHMGWNKLEVENESLVFKNIEEELYVYYVHSFYATGVKSENLLAYSNYGGLKIPGAVFLNNVFGMQFHPEKSGEVGLKILKNFGEMIKCK